MEQAHGLLPGKLNHGPGPSGCENGMHLAGVAPSHADGITEPPREIVGGGVHRHGLGRDHQLAIGHAVHGLYRDRVFGRPTITGVHERSKERAHGRHLGQELPSATGRAQEGRVASQRHIGTRHEGVVLSEKVLQHDRVDVAGRLRLRRIHEGIAAGNTRHERHAESLVRRGRHAALVAAARVQ